MSNRIMQAIQTKYLGPTNVRGSRVKATCAAGSTTVHWNDSLNAEDNHACAAAVLAQKLGWNHGLHGGQLKDGTYAWVLL